MNKEKIHKQRKQMKLNIKSKLIGAFAILLLVPSISIGLISYETAKMKVQDELRLSATSSVDLTDRLITQMIESKNQDIEILSQELEAVDSPATQLVLDRYQKAHPELQNTYIGLESNGQFISSPPSKQAADYDSRKRSWYQDAMANKGKVVVSQPYASASTGAIVLTISKTISDGKGVVALNERC